MKLTIEPIPPFNFELSSMIFSEDDPQIRRFENHQFWQAIRINDKLILVKISSKGNVDNPELLVELKSNENITIQDKNKVKKIINLLFNLDIDLVKFYSDVVNDKILYTITQKLKGLKSPNNLSIFEGLVCSITEQQISLNVAIRLQQKLTKKFGEVLNLNRKYYYVFPTPQTLASVNIDHLRSCGLSQRKAEYIKNISKLITNDELDLEAYRTYSDSEEIINDLSQYYGIGRWTVELTMIRSMQRFDVVPADDLGLRRWIAHYYYNNKMVNSKEVRNIAERWGKWKGLAAFYFLIIDQMGEQCLNI